MNNIDQLVQRRKLRALNFDIRDGIRIDRTSVVNYEKMMKKFNQLNDEYNKMAINGYIEKGTYLSDDEREREREREKDYEMINILKKINSNITQKILNVKSQREDLEKYTSYKTNIEKVTKAIDDVNNLYEDIVIKSNNFFSFDIPKVEKKIFEKDQIDLVINAVNDVINDRISKIVLLNQTIVEYKKLVKQCLPKEDVEIIQAINNELLCSICLTNKINVCINPCGHTFCDKCTDHMKSSCYMCKCNVSNKVKLFLSTNGESDNNDNDNDNIEVQPRPANFDVYAPINAFNFNEVDFNANLGEAGNEVQPRPANFDQIEVQPRPANFDQMNHIDQLFQHLELQAPIIDNGVDIDNIPVLVPVFRNIHQQILEEQEELKEEELKEEELKEEELKEEELKELKELEAQLVNYQIEVVN